ncbi:hypothetical protein C0Q70_02030 [Pomacea canaliculata]|uniref:Ribosomal L1 domain-containing protein 1 n=1 Tax=Pomacea canaliculata TaxID=400727 RepID=A0A2T7Q182_POMCA|nr:hypothetical protein C0Q70_02030 [Pomacea canaliculata]
MRCLTGKVHSSRRYMVQKGVDALLQVIKKEKTLLEEYDPIFLVFCVKKIPKRHSTTLKLEVCLFVKDLERRDREYEKTVQHFKDFLKSRDINVSAIVPLKALKLEYKSFEAKRNLANMYDLFLADARIIRLLPPYLGKAFYGRKRQPVQVRLDANDLKAEFDSAISNSRCLLHGRGSAGTATVANRGMSAEEITQNILASAEQLAAVLPGGVSNVRSMHIKTRDSLAIPIYLSLDSPNDVTLEEQAEQKELVEAEEVTTVQGALVKAYPSGYVELLDETTKVPLYSNHQKKHAGRRAWKWGKESQKKRKNYENKGAKRQEKMKKIIKRKATKKQ